MSATQRPRHSAVQLDAQKPCRHLASALSDAGKMAEAKEAFSEMMRNYPGLTVAKFRQAMPSAPTVDRMVENLRKLGLPD